MVMPHDDRLALYDATYPDRADLYVGGQLDPARHARVNEYNRKISRQEK
jgi:hypothetical protein